MSAYEQIEELFDRPAAAKRYGEVVTIAEHMLQAAACAVAESAEPALVIAALLHDVGHLVDAESADERNRAHAEAGADVLVPWFPQAVTEPVRLHIPAKRYLVAVDPSYRSELSPASVHTLGLQGGPMNDTECEAFLAESFADDALRVRRWDEAAKVDHLEVPPLQDYRALIDSCAGADG